MHDAFAVSFVERIRDLGPDLQHLLDRHRAFVQPVCQCLAFQVFHDQKVDAVLRADVVQGANVRVIQEEMARASRSKRCFESGLQDR